MSLGQIEDFDPAPVMHPELMNPGYQNFAPAPAPVPGPPPYPAHQYSNQEAQPFIPPPQPAHPNQRSDWNI